MSQRVTLRVLGGITAITPGTSKLGKNDEMTAITPLGSKNCPLLQSTPAYVLFIFFRFSKKFSKFWDPVFKLSTQAHSSCVIACRCPIFHPLALATNSIKLKQIGFRPNFFKILLIFKKTYS